MSRSSAKHRQSWLTASFSHNRSSADWLSSTIGSSSSQRCLSRPLISIEISGLVLVSLLSRPRLSRQALLKVSFGNILKLLLMTNRRLNDYLTVFCLFCCARNTRIGFLSLRNLRWVKCEHKVSNHRSCRLIGRLSALEQSVSAIGFFFNIGPPLVLVEGTVIPTSFNSQLGLF